MLRCGCTPARMETAALTERFLMILKKFLDLALGITFIIVIERRVAHRQAEEGEPEEE